MSIKASVDGLGVCLESTPLARKELAAGLLVRPLADDGPEVHAHRLACRIEKKDLPKIVTFKTWLTSVVFDVGV